MKKSSSSRRSGKALLIVSLLLLVAGVVLVAWQMTSGGPDRPQSLRGGGVVQLDQAGPHSIYVYRGASQRMDAAAQQAWDAARTAQVTVRDEQSGNELAVRSVYETTEMQNNLMARLIEFDAPTPGNYVVEIQPSLDAISPSVRPSAPLAELQLEIASVLLGLAACGLGVLLIVIGGVLLLVALLRKTRPVTPDGP